MTESVSSNNSTKRTELFKRVCDSEKRMPNMCRNGKRKNTFMWNTSVNIEVKIWTNYWDKALNYIIY